MRAAVLEKVGGVPRVREFEDPSATDSGVVVDVDVAGLNPVDIATAGGLMGEIPIPSVAGREGIARLDGRRVYFERSLRPFGSFAERTLIDPSQVIEVPEGVADELAVAFGIAGLAAWLPLSWRAELAEGEDVVVLGASSVVGQIAVQAAKLLGAGRVVAAARDEGMLRRCRELGADETVSLLGGREEIAERLREATGGGPSLVLDMLWGEPALAALDALAPRGRLVQIGNSAAPQAEVAPRALRRKLASILFYINFQAPLEAKAEAFQRMCRHAQAGELHVDVEVVPLDRIGEAWERQQAGPHRKLVIRP
jgi:NADPH2:quinone reductase